MDLRRVWCVYAVVVIVVNYPCSVTAGDIVHDDDSVPKKPGCENDFILVNMVSSFCNKLYLEKYLHGSLLFGAPPSFITMSLRFTHQVHSFCQVKVQTWVDGIEDSEFVGVGARFGTTIVSKEKNAHQTRLTLSNPRDCCSPPKNKLAGDVIMVHRGHCKFTTKANVAQAAGASAVLIINNQKELYKMVCEPDETDLDIHIPAIMLPQDAGSSLEKMLMNSSSVSVQLYSPRRPLVDIAEVFLWLMAVSTILCASFWSAWSAREAAIEQEKLLKDVSDDFANMKDVGTGGVVNINTTSAVLFVVIASCFLVILYKLMSSWFVEVLVVLFAIGGAEGMQICLVALLSRGDVLWQLHTLVAILGCGGINNPTDYGVIVAEELCGSFLEPDVDY
ncbi:Signal peptide peptidase-like 2 [Sarracenia purpurea var. burkii]